MPRQCVHWLAMTVAVNTQSKAGDTQVNEGRWRDGGPVPYEGWVRSFDALYAVGFVTGTELSGKGGEEFLLHIIHAAPVQAGGFCVLADGLALHETAPEEGVIGCEGGLQAGGKEVQILPDDLVVLLGDDVALLLVAELEFPVVLHEMLADILGIAVIVRGAAVETGRIVLIFQQGVLGSGGAIVGDEGPEGGRADGISVGAVLAEDDLLAGVDIAGDQGHMDQPSVVAAVGSGGDGIVCHGAASFLW